MKKSKSHYNKNRKPLAQALRNDSTPAEALLWSKVLRARQFHGYQFNRQFPIQKYIADFVCRRLKLIIEIDGYSHNFKAREDRQKDKDLTELGYTVVRFSEKEVRRDLDNVMRVLEQFVPKADMDDQP